MFYTHSLIQIEMVNKKKKKSPSCLKQGSDKNVARNKRTLMAQASFEGQ